ncbi:MAG: hypothetical protein R3D67_01545 [Hyphomicrobiaceae bacterium]
MRLAFKCMALATFCFAIALASPEMALARVEKAASSRVSMDIPAGYEQSPLFSGFVNKEEGVSIVVVEMPDAAYDQVAKGLTADALAAKGLRNAKVITLSRPPPYVFMRAEQKTPEGDYDKLMLVLRERGTTALVTANIRKTELATGPETEKQVQGILASARITADPAPPRKVYTLGYLGPFKPADTILGTTQAYTLDGKIEPERKDVPRAILIVAPSLDRRPVPPDDKYAEKLLEGLPGLTGFKIHERSIRRIASLEAVELTATAHDKDQKGKVFVYQALLLGSQGGYYRIVGQAPLADSEALMPVFRKIAESFRPIE